MSHQSLYLRLRWPGIDTPAERVTTPLGDAIARTVYAVTRQPDDVVEALLYTGAQTQELLLAAGDRTLEATAPLIRTAQDELPRTMGFELVEATSLGTTPALSACLLGPTPPSERVQKRVTTPYPDLSPPSTALRQYLETLIDRRLPHVVRVVVRNAGSDREVSLRVALYHRDHQWISDSDHAAALNAGTLDPATYFTDEAITSSWQLPLEGTWSVAADAPLLEAPHESARLYLDAKQIRALEYDAAHQPTRRKRLARSPAVFDAVRERHFSSEQRRAYASFDVDPWLTVDAETLPAFLDHVPAYYEQDLWPAVPGWDRFDLSVKSVLREPSGTTPGATPEAPSPSDPGARLDLDSPADRQQQIVEWFATRGRLHQARNFAHAHFEAIRKGCAHPVRIVADETLAGGDLIGAVSDARRADTTAYIVADTTATANQITEILSHPFCETTPDRTRLYSTTRCLKATEQLVVYPRDVDPPEWWVTPAGTVELWAGDDCLGRWDPPLEVPTLSESLPSCRPDGGGYVVTDPVGNRQMRAATAEDVVASWLPLPAPSVPTFLASGLHYATVLTPTIHGFREHQHRPEWVTADSPTYRTSSFTNEVLERFCDRYTVPTDTDPLDSDQLVPRLCTWLRTIDPYGFEFELDPGSVDVYLDVYPDEPRQLRYPPSE
ncbi:hypothetical protein SAMN04488065_1568 [Haloplanus vescus]|uniref:Uncharacterized protein n=1 Tax=Haloplanus vescus TaxID=555874 RepID=A0A1H3XIC6_9EURY|nr:hypothetical protein [Haloplanus vescus]SDZ98711.1 hypothetical protein SAMN04488065_1568 [Haloplanus vescus]